MQNFIHRIVDTVKMPFRTRAHFRITHRFFQNTQLFLCRDRDRTKIQPAFPQNRQRLFRHRPRDRLRRQVKEFLPMPFPDRFKRRKYRRKCLSNPGRGLDKQPAPALQRPVNRHRQIPLSRPVRIGKFERFD